MDAAKEKLVNDTLRAIARRECALTHAVGMTCKDLGLCFDVDHDPDLTVVVACAACLAQAAMLTVGWGY